MSNMDISVREVDSDAWMKFTGYCKMKGRKVGIELSDLLKKFLRSKQL